MKRIFKKFEQLMMAAAFAEAGEHETAREIIKEQKRAEDSERIRPVKRPKRELRA